VFVFNFAIEKLIFLPLLSLQTPTNPSNSSKQAAPHYSAFEVAAKVRK
jgi:hypothetical protein